MNRNSSKSANRKRAANKQRMVVKGNTTGVVQKFSLMPRPFRAQEVRSILIRTVSNGVFNSTILRSDLAALLGVTARSATTSFFMSGMAKLVKIECWAPVAVAGTSVTTSIEWADSSASVDFESPPVTFSDTSVSFDRPAHLQQHPPKRSLAREWWDTNSTSAIINFACPAGTTVDFLLDWVLDDGLAAFNHVGPTLIAATPGQHYHHPVQAILIPQSVQSL
jgi:hypothetical protein